MSEWLRRNWKRKHAALAKERRREAENTICIWIMIIFCGTSEFWRVNSCASWKLAKCKSLFVLVMNWNNDWACKSTLIYVYTKSRCAQFSRSNHSYECECCKRFLCKHFRYGINLSTWLVFLALCSCAQRRFFLLHILCISEPPTFIRLSVGTLVVSR